MNMNDTLARRHAADTIRRERSRAKGSGHDMAPMTVSPPTRQHGYLFYSRCRKCGQTLVVEYLSSTSPIEVRGTTLERKPGELSNCPKWVEETR